MSTDHEKLILKDLAIKNIRGQLNDALNEIQILEDRFETFKAQLEADRKYNHRKKECCEGYMLNWHAGRLSLSIEYMKMIEYMENKNKWCGSYECGETCRCAPIKEQLKEKGDE